MGRKRNKPEKPKTEHTAGKDLVGFLLFVLSVFLFLSLVSYDVADPSFHTTALSNNVEVVNWGGILGSYVADIFVQWFGYMSVGLVALGLFFAWAVPFNKLELIKKRHAVGLGFVVISLFILVGFGRSMHHTMLSYGGAVGYFLNGVSRLYLGTIGAVLLVPVFLFTGLYVLFNLSVRVVLEYLARWMPSLAMKNGFQRLQAFVMRRTQRREATDQLEGSKLKNTKLAALKMSSPALAKVKNFDHDAEEESDEEERDEFEPNSEPIELSPDDEERIKNIPINIQGASLNDHTIPPLARSANEVWRPTPSKTHFELPSSDLLQDPDHGDIVIDKDELLDKARLLETKLKDFGVSGKVVGVQPGPVVTMYEFEPAPGVKVNQIVRLNDDLALALRALSVRITLLPGKSVVGIEVANEKRQTVFFKEVIRDKSFKSNPSLLTLALGKDISGSPYVADLRRMPHLLIAGATGSGKSVAINSVILSILYNATPDQVRMILVDPKMLELNLYDTIPHLLLPVVTDPKKAAAALRWAVSEMERRYKLMADFGVRNIEGYNKKITGEGKAKAETGQEPLPSTEPQVVHDGALPFIMIVIDELADLMMVSSREVEDSIIRLAQMARASGIHLLLATQRPSVDVITGVIKANMPARISFQVSSKIDSRTIIDANGAESLLGSGDMLFLPPGSSKLVRVHGAFVSDQEVQDVTNHWKQQGKPQYHEEILKEQEIDEALASSGDPDDDLYRQALTIVRTSKIASISLIQRKLRIGYNRAARLVERMDDEGLLAPGEVGKPREVLVSRLGGPQP